MPPRRPFPSDPPARSVSIYLLTDPTSPREEERIELENLTAEATRQLEQARAPNRDENEGPAGRGPFLCLSTAQPSGQLAMVSSGDCQTSW